MNDCKNISDLSAEIAGIEGLIRVIACFMGGIEHCDTPEPYRMQDALLSISTHLERII